MPARPKNTADHTHRLRHLLSGGHRQGRRYDGQFVTAVHTTGIYCRPSCPARLPHAENLSF
ncbi:MULTISPECIES: Ada metal-binding domain-containing protein [unclassified Streptomyces]|uniref:Ada metal-binding domain-containing protein n=1 Tax=unclassified Streptomyces TaxID=2593676 RepID=UPI003865FC27